jgi:hypothetical protein
MSAVLWTIGHSTRPIDEFLKLLQAHNIESLMDVRTVPRLSIILNSTSTRWPIALQPEASATSMHVTWADSGNRRKIP